MGPPPERQASISEASHQSQPIAGTSRRPNPQALMRERLGTSTFNSIRSLMLRQQATYVQQLFELHKLSQVCCSYNIVTLRLIKQKAIAPLLAILSKSHRSKSSSCVRCSYRLQTTMTE